MTDKEFPQITPDNFPPGTTILTFEEGYEAPWKQSTKEYACIQWSAKGRCKIYDVLADKTFWTLENPNYIILEVLPKQKFSTPYDVSAVLLEQCFSGQGFSPLYNLEWLK